MERESRRNATHVLRRCNYLASGTGVATSASATSSAMIGTFLEWISKMMLQRHAVPIAKLVRIDRAMSAISKLEHEAGISPI
jgi:hypothetical protein